MKKRIVRPTLLLAFACMLCFVLLFTGCGKKKDPNLPSPSAAPSASSSAVPVSEETELKVSDLPLIHATEFGGVYLDLTIGEFNDLGFQYGDSLNIVFSNGYVLKDIPYYNGFYTRNKEPLLVAYPGYPHIRAGFNNGDDLWEVAELKKDDTGEIVLNEQGKYLDIQKARDIHYTDERDDYPSDEIFANFRSLSGGTLKESLVYRSASPVDNQHNRAPFTDALMEDAHVRFILDLADDEEKMKKYLAEPDFSSPYFLSLYKDGKVKPLSMNTIYDSDEFKEKAASGCRAMLQAEGPYLIHCTEGKDRTGFFCLLLEALAGASYKELVSDYMITYDNYYQINPESQAKKYETIIDQVLHPMIEIIAGKTGLDFGSEDYAADAKNYLMSGGMTEEEIEKFQALLTK